MPPGVSFDHVATPNHSLLKLFSTGGACFLPGACGASNKAEWGNALYPTASNLQISDPPAYILVPPAYISILNFVPR